MALIATSLWLTSAPTVARAQQRVEKYASAEPSSDQVKLNQSAVDAILAEDYEKAVGLLKASLELGELNVTWLNLGRAHQKLGNCEEARNAYLSVVTSPAVADPPASLINAKAEQYLEELDEACPKDDQTAGASGQEVKDEPNDSQAEVTQGGEGAPPAEDSNVLGWSTTLGGVALLGVGATFAVLGSQEHAVVEAAFSEENRAQDGAVLEMSRQQAIEHRDTGNTYNTIAVSAAIAGTAVTGLGLYWLFSDDTDTTVTMGAGADGWSVGFATSF